MVRHVQLPSDVAQDALELTKSMEEVVRDEAEALAGAHHVLLDGDVISKHEVIVTLGSPLASARFH